VTCRETDSGALVDGRIVTWRRGSQLRVRLEDGRELRAISVLEVLEEAECPGALIVNRPVQVRMYTHPKLPRIVRVGRPDQ
jgi:hypothetical protein